MTDEAACAAEAKIDPEGWPVAGLMLRGGFLVLAAKVDIETGKPSAGYRTALRANASDGVAAYNLAALLLSHGNKASLDAAEEVESRPMMSLPDRLIDVVTDESGKIENRTMSKSLLDEVGSLLSVALSDTRIASKRTDTLDELSDLMTALAIRNEADAIQLLASLGVPTEVRDDQQGQTPLQLAECFGSDAAVQALLAAGADPDAVDPGCPGQRPGDDEESSQWILEEEGEEEEDSSEDEDEAE